MQPHQLRQFASKLDEQNESAISLAFCRKVKNEMLNPDNHTEHMDLDKATKQYDEAVDRLLATFGAKGK